MSEEMKLEGSLEPTVPPVAPPIPPQDTPEPPSEPTPEVPPVKDDDAWKRDIEAARAQKKEKATDDEDEALLKSVLEESIPPVPEEPVAAPAEKAQEEKKQEVEEEPIQTQVPPVADQEQIDKKVQSDVATKRAKVVLPETFDIFDDGDDTQSSEAAKEDPYELTVKDYLMSIPVGTNEDVRNLANEYGSRAEYQKALRDNSTFVSQYMAAADGGLRNRYVTNARASMKAADISEEDFEEVNSSEIKDGFTRGKHFGKREDGSVPDLVGHNAQLMLIARAKGILKVNLLNSGFYVVLRPLSLAEISGFLNTVQMNATELGHTLGAHMWLCNDIFLKEQFINALIQYGGIEDSNLENWKKNGALYKNINVLDYETLVWAIVSLMYRRGLHTRIFCPKCKKADETEINPITCKFRNRKIFDEIPEVRSYWETTGKLKSIPLQKIRDYQEKVNPMTYYSEQTLQELGKIRLVFKSPSIGEYLTVGTDLINRINEAISGTDEERQQQVGLQLIYHVYQMMIPWIHHVEVFNEDGTIDYTTSEKAAIEMVLESGRQEAHSEKLMSDFNSFIGATRITWIGTIGLECPSCHAKPVSGSDMFFPLDVQSIFFAQSFQ